MTKITREQVLDLLMTNNRAVERALLVLLSYQTATEQNAMATQDDNGCGFTSADARVMTSMATQVKNGRILSEKQLSWLRGGNKRSRIGKYAAQIARHATANPKGTPAQ